MFEFREIVSIVDDETHIYPTDLKLEIGKFNVLLGPTGSGKTSLMRLMTGLDTPTSGTIWFKDEDVTGISVQKRNVAMVYQQFINYPSFNVFENIASPLQVAKVAAKEIKEQVYEIAKLLKLETLLDRRPNELSGGQQQRIALARALVKKSDLILLDEPLANLDYKLREELRDELPKLLKHTGGTIVYATTEPMEALMLGGNTVLLHEGRIIQFGETISVYESPSSLKSAMTFSDPPLNIIQVKKEKGKISISPSIHWETPNQLKSLADGSYTLGIRPHHITLHQEDTTQIHLNGLVDISEITGSETMVYFTQENNQWISQSHGVHLYQPGDIIKAYINIEYAMYFNQVGELIHLSK